MQKTDFSKMLNSAFLGVPFPRRRLALLGTGRYVSPLVQALSCGALRSPPELHSALRPLPGNERGLGLPAQGRGWLHIAHALAVTCTILSHLRFFKKTIFIQT